MSTLIMSKNNLIVTVYFLIMLVWGLASLKMTVKLWTANKLPVYKVSYLWFYKHPCMLTVKSFGYLLVLTATCIRFKVDDKKYSLNKTWMTQTTRFEK